MDLNSDEKPLGNSLGVEWHALSSALRAPEAFSMTALVLLSAGRSGRYLPSWQGRHLPGLPALIPNSDVVDNGSIILRPQAFPNH